MIYVSISLNSHVSLSSKHLLLSLNLKTHEVWKGLGSKKKLRHLSSCDESLVSIYVYLIHSGSVQCEILLLIWAPWLWLGFLYFLFFWVLNIGCWLVIIRPCVSIGGDIEVVSRFWFFVECEYVIAIILEFRSPQAPAFLPNEGGGSGKWAHARFNYVKWASGYVGCHWGEGTLNETGRALGTIHWNC